MNLSNFERETIIIFNEAEPNAVIQVHNNRIRRRLEQIEAERPDEVSHDHNGDFVIPKGWIKINPSHKRELTDEQREQMGRRLLEARLSSKTI